MVCKALFPWSLFRRTLLEVRLIYRRGTTKNCCFSSFCEVTRMFRRNVVKCSDIKGGESTDGYLSPIHVGCCRLCVRNGNGAPGRIPSGKKIAKEGYGTPKHGAWEQVFR
ncbi:hypothetical protein AVEN_48486-1 [Araneus ventricosus]|uniref:Uncharacterized protein n=1 Tax=Araneus ventricosus TaxID=182803 RepID=A0A4Y2F9H9_ARAVE|nr:hypothetical protein AVEN_48486-1 [Araneus ventricosus]